MSYIVKFAGNDLSKIKGSLLHYHDFNRLPSREININKLARRDKSIITSSEYSQKEIPVKFEVCGGDRSKTELVLAKMKGLVQAQNQPLVVSQGGIDIVYTATMSEFNIEWNGAMAYVEVLFLASDPIGTSDLSVTAVNQSGITTSVKSATVLFEGSTKNYPIIVVTINSLTDGANKSVVLENSLTNQGIKITRDWASGDVLVIDSNLMTVTVNGINTDFTGMFPEFPSGSQQVQYVDGFSARNVDMTVTYKPRYV